MSKYHNVKTIVDGTTFASRHEAERYCELAALLRSGEIRSFELQKPFSIDIDGQHICKYIADFAYYTRDGKWIVEDAKGVKTPVYRLKKKLVKALYNIDIVEV